MNNPTKQRKIMQKFVVSVSALIVSLAYSPSSMAGGTLPVWLKGNDQDHARVIIPQKDQPLQPPPGTLWYNGDWNLSGNSANGICFSEDPFDDGGYNDHVYDNFTVPSPGNWHVTAVFSDNLEQGCGDFVVVIGAIWAFRQG